MKTDWLSAVDLSYQVVEIGLVPGKFPFQVVLSRQSILFDCGEQQMMDEFGNYLGTYHTYVKSRRYTVAARYAGTILKIPLDISVGVSRKKAFQHDIIPYEGENIFYDCGFLTALPIRLPVENKFAFSVTPAFGYSVSNLGKNVRIEGYGTYPAPKTSVQASLYRPE